MRFLHSSVELLIELGYKFETLSLLNQPWDSTTREEIESRDELVVNNNAQYCSIVRTGIGKTRLIIGGEVDAGMETTELLQAHMLIT